MMHTEDPSRMQAGRNLEELIEEVSGEKWDPKRPVFTNTSSGTDRVDVYLEY